MKTSLHESGAWHSAFSPDYLERNTDFPGRQWGSRFVEKWTRPHENAPGTTLACRILTPAASVTTQVVPEQTKGLVWIEPPPPGLALGCYVVITRPGVISIGWPARKGMGSQLVGRFSTHTGDTVWVVSTREPMPTFSKQPDGGRVRLFRGKSPEDLRGPHVRAILMNEQPDGSRLFVDVTGDGIPEWLR